MAKLSEILEMAEEARGSAVYGVEVDVESFTPPPGLKEIGLLMTVRDGDIDETLVDVMISYNLAGVQVILEIPHDLEEVEAEYLMSVAANAGFSIALLPPHHSQFSPEVNQGYTDRLVAFTRAYLRQANFSHFLYPITSFLEYMFSETLRDVTSFQPTDPYIVSRFVEPVTEEFSDGFKAVLRQVFYDHFGGEAGFRQFARALVYKIYKQTEENARQLADEMVSQQPLPLPPPPSEDGQGTGEAVEEPRAIAAAAAN